MIHFTFSMMNSASLSLLLPIYPTPRLHALTLTPSSSSFLHLRRHASTFPPMLTTKPRFNRTASFAYVTGPASDPIVTEADPKLDDSDSPTENESPPSNLIGWGLLWSLLSAHKVRLGLSVLALVGATTSTLSMPLFSGLYDTCLILIMVLFLFYCLNVVAIDDCDC